MEALPDKARKYAVKAINRALEGVTGTTAVHLCFGYAYVVKDKPWHGYHFLPELANCKVDQVSIEAAQPRLDELAMLRELKNKSIVFGVIDMGDPKIETPETVAARIRRGLEYVDAERLIVAPDCGMKYLKRDVAFAKLQAMVEGAKIVRKEL
jgi:5-methyltetrahydropteroyltriglutamate--homocysteine methyltransferase